MRNFRDLEIWQNGIFLVKDIYLVLKDFPSSEKFALVSQISRSAVSIPSNIAEGCARDSQKEFSRFLQIALGSAFELETQLLISREIGFISSDQFDDLKFRINNLQKRIHALKKYSDSRTQHQKTKTK